MTEEIRCIIGMCADCDFLYARLFMLEGEEVITFKCLITNDNVESITKRCSHFVSNNKESIFLNDEFKR
jgi:hypothetical protein